jgi:hypothetical protein
MTTADLLKENFVHNDWPSAVYEMITPSDSTVFIAPTREVFVGTAGQLVVRRLDGVIVTIPSSIITDGTSLPIRCDMIMAATTAQNILVLY